MGIEEREHIPFGNCEICTKPAETIYNLPIRREDGSLNTLACESCTKETGAYCDKHSRIHIGFDDETTACIDCIEDIVDKDALPIYESFSKAIEGTPKEFEILADLNDWAEASSQVTGDRKWRSIVRAIVTVSERKGMSFDEVIQETIEAGSEFVLT